MYCTQYNLMSSDVVRCFKISSQPAPPSEGDTHKLSVVRTRQNSVNDREGELSFRDILAETFIVRVLCILQVLVVVSDLE
jgi:hypothetical protein